MTFRLAVVAVLTVAGLASAVAADDAAESAFRGRKLAEANCEECHAIAAADSSVIARAIPFRDLWQLPVYDQLRNELSGLLFVHHPEMPGFEPTPEQVEDLATYIESIQDRPNGD